MQIGDIVKLKVPKDHIGTVIGVDSDGINFVEYWTKEPPVRWVASMADEWLEAYERTDEGEST